MYEKPISSFTKMFFEEKISKRTHKLLGIFNVEISARCVTVWKASLHDIAYTCCAQRF